MKKTNKRIEFDGFNMKVWTERDIINDPYVNYYTIKAIETILSSKTELILYVKKLPRIFWAELGTTERDEIETINFAGDIWRLMISPYNFKYEQFQKAWRDCEK